MIGLSPSSYYYKQSPSIHQKQMWDTEIRDEIERLHTELPGYGYRRIYEHFLRLGLRINGKRIRRIMRENSLFPIIYRNFKVATTDSKHGFKTYENLAKHFLPTQVNQCWVADITYIKIKTAFVYLAAILDRYSRKIVGWGISKTIDHQLCLSALKSALSKRGNVEGCIHHSDRGVQYASNQYTDLLTRSGMKLSMSAKGNPYDNAFMESFFKTLKYEEMHLWNYESYEEVINRLPFFIEEVYNKKRFHSALEYLSPVEFEEGKINQSQSNSPQSN